MHTMVPKFARPRTVRTKAVRPSRVSLLLALALAGGSLVAATGASAASGQGHGGFLLPGNLLVSGSVYDQRPGPADAGRDRPAARLHQRLRDRHR